MECIVNILFTIYVFLNVINWIQISLIKNENVMTFKALRLLIFGVGISIEIVLFLIWKLNNFMVSYHFFENIFIYFKLVVAQSAFFSNNSGYELCMISSKTQQTQAIFVALLYFLDRETKYACSNNRSTVKMNNCNNYNLSPNGYKL
jgi:hypothetical protein